MQGSQSDSKDRSQDGGSNGTTGAISLGECEEMQIEALKELTRSAKGNVWRREYHFRSDPRRSRITPHLHCDFLCR